MTLFPLKFELKVTHPLSSLAYHSGSDTNIARRADPLR